MQGGETPVIYALNDFIHEIFHKIEVVMGIVDEG